MGAVVTWLGVPVRLAKVSNYIIAYAMRRFGLADKELCFAQMFGGMEGYLSGHAAAAARACISDARSVPVEEISAGTSWWAGIARADGQMQNAAELQRWLARAFSLDSDPKVEKLWPNPLRPDNFSPGAGVNTDERFYRPRFLSLRP